MARILPLAVPLFLMACAGDQGVKAFNAEPEAEITSHSDADEVLEGYTESFRGVVSDPDHAAEDLTATWYLDGEVVCESASPDADGISLCDVLIPATATEITLEVQDPGNAAGSDQISLTVVPTESPEAEITALNPMHADIPDRKEEGGVRTAYDERSGRAEGRALSGGEGPMRQTRRTRQAVVHGEA